MTRLSTLSKNRFFPSRDQAGILPPPEETCHRPPPAVSGNGRTYTSYKPDSSDAYAIQRPSGENAGCTSFAGVRANGSGVAGLGWSGSVTSKGMVQISKFVPLRC